MVICRIRLFSADDGFIAGAIQKYFRGFTVLKKNYTIVFVCLQFYSCITTAEFALTISKTHDIINAESEENLPSTKQISGRVKKGYLPGTRKVPFQKNIREDLRTMKKNLKKVISAVIALALSISSIATVSFAKSYSDVASTASYAEAVNVLSALGILEGTGDGFKPENTIKRSEAAKIIVGMMNKLSAADNRKGATSFTDVSADHWASGYINLGSANGWINGKGNGKFDPDGEVKNEEVLKMIVANLGYSESYVAGLGGYPEGYTKTAENEEIVDAGKLDYKAAATRGSVAEMVYNAMQAPIMKDKGNVYNSLTQTWVPSVEKQDGEDSKYFKSILSEYFDAYIVEGSVTATSKTASDRLEADQVDFKIQKCEKYNSEVVVEKASLNKLSVGDTDAANYLNTYATALVKVDEDGQAELIAFTPSAKNQTVTLDASLFDDDECKIADVIKTVTITGTTGSTTVDQIQKNATLRYFASEDSAKSTKYTLSQDATLYVNGVEVPVTVANFNTYIFNNPVGTVELIDVYTKGNVADGEYDIINVEYYATAQVSGISGDKIVLKNYYDPAKKFTKATLDLDTEDNEDLVYSIVYNGEEISIGELKKNDIISIAWDVTATSVEKSNFFDIYVSRDVASGKLTSLLPEEGTIIVGGEEYSSVKGYSVQFQTLNRGSEYDLYLDAFGRVYITDKTASNVKYAIIYKYFDDGMSDFKKGSFFLADGTTASYEIDLGATGLTDTTITALVGKTNVYERVVSYTLKDNVVVTMTELTAKGGTISEYKESTGRVSGIKIDSATALVDAVKFGKTKKNADLTLADIDNMVDGQKYTVYGFGEADSGVYPFAIITTGSSAYTEETKVAVIKKAPYETSDEDGTEGFGLDVVIGGNDETLFVEDGTTLGTGKMDDISDLAVGDAIVYTTDTTGAIDEIQKMFSINNKIYNTALTNIFANIENYTSFVALPSTEWTNAWYPSESGKVSLVFAPIIEVADNGDFTIAQVKKETFTTTTTTGTTSVDKYVTWVDEEVAKNDTAPATTGATMVIGVDDNTRVYKYDYNKSKLGDRVDTAVASEIVASNVAAYEKFDSAKSADYIDWTAANTDGVTVNFAFAKVVDGVATDVYVIIGD